MDRDTSHVSLFVPTSLREALERSAAENDRSLSTEIRSLSAPPYTSEPSGIAQPTPSSSASKEKEEP